MKYAFMDSHTRVFRIKAVCRVLCVSRSGFYAWRQRRRQPSALPERSAQLDQRVRRAYEIRKGRLGAPGLTRDLGEQGHGYNRKTVAESLWRQGLRAKAARKFKATTHSRHNLPLAPNQLGQDFAATVQNHKWVSDITYL